MVYQSRRQFLRFAPTPSAYLHHGHLYSFLFVLKHCILLEKNLKVRLDDLDSKRCQSQFSRACIEDIQSWIEIFGASVPLEFVFQTQHAFLYQKTFSLLKASSQVYACSCSRSDIKKRIKTNSETLASSYDGYCRNRNLDFQPDFNFRLRTQHQKISFLDMGFGKCSETLTPGRDDFVLLNKEGYYSYNFSGAIDDYFLSSPLLIRGKDLLGETFKQKYLWKIFNNLDLKKASSSEEPDFFHHRLVAGMSQLQQEKLSKRNLDARVAGRFSSKQIRAVRSYLSSDISRNKTHKLRFIEEAPLAALFLQSFDKSTF